MPMLAIEGMVVVILCGYDLCCVVWPDGMTCGEDARLKSLDFERVAQLHSYAFELFLQSLYFAR